MLVLTRKIHQGIHIGETVEITVIEVRGDQVSLGITAPRDVRVDRKEIADLRAAEKASAAKSEASE